VVRYDFKMKQSLDEEMSDIERPELSSMYSLGQVTPLDFIRYYTFTDTFDIFEWDPIPSNYTQSK
jgi:hypothetical protein